MVPLDCQLDQRKETPRRWATHTPGHAWADHGGVTSESVRSLPLCLFPFLSASPLEPANCGLKALTPQARQTSRVSLQLSRTLSQ